MARENSIASESGATPAAAGGEGYGVLMISGALGATEVIALEKVRAQPFARYRSSNDCSGRAGALPIGSRSCQQHF